MRIATWNVNSLKARLEKVEWWLDRAQPDVILLQETKLSRNRWLNEVEQLGGTGDVAGLVDLVEDRQQFEVEAHRIPII